MIVQALIGELFALVGYGLLLAAVYKLFQIGADLREVKALLKTGRNSVNGPGASRELGDSAAEYAENLLRAVSSGSSADASVRK